jgi:hypothetical protein
MPILKNAFIMVNPLMSSRVPYGGNNFHTMGNPQPRVPSIRGNVYNPHHVSSAGMVSIQPFMNQFGGGYYPIEQGHGIYQNPIWPAIPQPQYFLRAWAQTPQPQLPFLSMLNLAYF